MAPACNLVNRLVAGRRRTCRGKRLGRRGLGWGRPRAGANPAGMLELWVGNNQFYHQSSLPKASGGVGAKSTSGKRSGDASRVPSAVIYAFGFGGVGIKPVRNPIDITGRSTPANVSALGQGQNRPE